MHHHLDQLQHVVQTATRPVGNHKVLLTLVLDLLVLHYMLSLVPMRSLCMQLIPVCVVAETLDCTICIS